MTNNEAIKWIKYHIGISPYEDTDELKIALLMAIQALEETKEDDKTSISDPPQYEYAVFLAKYGCIDQVSSTTRSYENAKVIYDNRVSRFPDNDYHILQRIVLDWEECKNED